ncbi:magnesium transporter NIPA-domain-containing protein [Gamsiella multidivaricata]|uniref:magnesium transporter NIPA-domain-containing protein n=1 Tax=Gamsiella multidivaricata TaxID=101098 RepID=UPI0022201112|nr:magnesium transporter NIPA-domain-containing protein [Gamsiella multidivaricata]KAG0358790.1 NIPA-like protein 3 [Gamsiella multidivaricata]KAI7825725.1 magnesium transporter NIPA-domain-containing protein [Gamsiella multidivaricata]
MTSTTTTTIAFAIRTLLIISTFLTLTTALPTVTTATHARNHVPVSASASASIQSSSSSSLSYLTKRDTPAGMPTACTSDFDCLGASRPPHWPQDHPTVQSGNYACVFGQGSNGSIGINSTTTPGTGSCQFVVTAGEQCNAPTDCAAFAFYTQFGLTVPSDLCSPQHCTLESTCGSPWQDNNAPSNHTFTNVRGGEISCCGGQPVNSVCTLVGSNVDSCEYHSTCNFDLDEHQSDDPSQNNGFTLDQMRQQGLGFCQKIDQRNHVWIGVVITLISSTVLNVGLNGQKYALRKHDEKRVLKGLEMEEEHERWRQEFGWTEEQVQEEADRLYEEKENRRGKLYRRLKPYMFWRNIFVSKLWAAGLLVFILGNLGGFIALRFAPQSLTAPLGSISLISNVIIAPLINKEVLGKWDIAGIFFIVAGSVMVVVFSGIVAQDYKLCVLINLFHKPATIVYLSFIGICIIFTFFFIRFVEKNVENEADVAIGVSSERQLQQEGRLYRIHSNASNFSLAAKERHSTSMHGILASSSPATATNSPKELDAEKAGESLRDLETPVKPFSQESEIALNTSDSRQTITSDESGTAVGASSAAGTDHPHDQRRPSFGSSRSSKTSRLSILGLEMNAESSRVGKHETHLRFGEPPATGKKSGIAGTTPIAEVDAGPSRPGNTHSQSGASSVISNTQPVRRRRNRHHTDKHEDGAPFTIWERIKRVELIPSLPEDKLIRRNSPLLRFCLPLSYAALGGMMASYTVLFAKSLINLLVTSIFDGQNQFTSGLAWVILVVTVVTAVSQVYWINMGLKKYDALLQVPVFFTIWVLLDIVGGGIYYGEFTGFTAKKYVLFCLGVLIVFFGVALLAKRLAVLAKEDVGESQPTSAAALGRQSPQPSMSDATADQDEQKKAD